jgi:hypothetical protein
MGFTASDILPFTRDADTAIAALQKPRAASLQRPAGGSAADACGT